MSGREEAFARLRGERGSGRTPTGGGEEGLLQLVVGGDLPDFRADVEEPPHHRRDPVEAQQPGKGGGAKWQDQASGCLLYKLPPGSASTCPGERLRSPRCVFQSRRSRRG